MFTPNASYTNILNANLVANIGGVDKDIVNMEFYNAAPAAGVHDLSSGADADYQTCDYCLTMYMDVDANNVLKKYFFQAGGMMIVSSTGAQPNEAHGFLQDITLIEVTIDPNTFHSTPVPGGECYSIPNATW